jgi:hypothetical protein
MRNVSIAVDELAYSNTHGVNIRTTWLLYRPFKFHGCDVRTLGHKNIIVIRQKGSANEQSSSVAIALVMHFNAKALTVTGCPNTVVFLRGLY